MNDMITSDIHMDGYSSLLEYDHHLRMRQLCVLISLPWLFCLNISTLVSVRFYLNTYMALFCDLS